MVNVHFYRIDILDFSGTRARSVGVDGKEINHKTTTNILRNFATLVKTSNNVTYLAKKKNLFCISLLLLSKFIHFKAKFWEID